jgi:hypothetical protein
VAFVVAMSKGHRKGLVEQGWAGRGIRSAFIARLQLFTVIVPDLHRLMSRYVKSPASKAADPLRAGQTHEEIKVTAGGRKSLESTPPHLMILFCYRQKSSVGSLFVFY